MTTRTHNLTTTPRVLWILLGLVPPFAAPAAGEIRLFWSWTGISDPAKVFIGAEANFVPVFEAPEEILDCIAPGEYAVFLWGEFIENLGPGPNKLLKNSRINGLNLGLSGDASIDQSTAYRQRGPVPLGWYRWNNSVPAALDDALVAINTAGILFSTSPSHTSDLYYPSTRKFLIGAALVEGQAGESVTAVKETLSLVGGATTAVVPATLSFCTLNVPGDMTCDSAVNFGDIDRFVLALQYPAGIGWPFDCPWLNADCNFDDQVNFDDIDPFVALLGS